MLEFIRGLINPALILNTTPTGCPKCRGGSYLGTERPGVYRCCGCGQLVRIVHHDLPEDSFCEPDFPPPFVRRAVRRDGESL